MLLSSILINTLDDRILENRIPTGSFTYVVHALAVEYRGPWEVCRA